MSKDEHVLKILHSMYEFVSCHECGTRIRFGDVECPHCGEDLDGDLREWAERLAIRLAG